MIVVRRGATLPARGGQAALIVGATVVGLLLGGLAVIGLPGTSALFTNQAPVNADLGAGRIFRGERDTPAFSVTDVSSGSSSDGSNAYAFASDGRYYSSYSFAASFSGTRYLELDLNAPLAAGLGASSNQLTVRFAGASAGTTTCIYVEIRRAASGSLVSTHGSSGSPLACSSGTTFTATNASLTSVTSTDVANDLRVRVYASDSAAGALRVDSVTIAGSTPYSSYTLYPILTRDVHDGQTDLIRWGLAGS